MKKLIVLTFLIIGNWAFADQWPYDPACYRYNATSETVQLFGTNEKVVLCKFGIGSMIDKNSLRYSPPGFGSEAVRAYRENGQDPFGKSCAFYRASLTTGVGSNQRSYSLCRWFDGSVMEDQTFQMGPRSAFNQEMNGALGITWP